MWPFKKEITYNIKVIRLKKLKKGEIYIFSFEQDVDEEALLEFGDCLKEAKKNKNWPMLVTNAKLNIIKTKTGKIKVKRCK